MDTAPAGYRLRQMFLLGVGAAVLASAIARKMRRIDFRGKTVLITGGSRGLGLEIARQLAREGARLVLLARNKQDLERARTELSEYADVLTIPCDLQNQEEVEQAIASAVQAGGRIDVLINNAGIVQVSPYENLDRVDFQDSMNIHAWGPLFAINAVVPHMKRQGGGRIVNISSIGGLVAVPHLLSYSMGKFALTGLSDGLRAELAKDNIRVTTVAPGLMRTGSHVNAYFKGQHQKEYSWFAVASANPALSTSVGNAARKIITSCRYGDARLIITIPATILHFMNANFPGVTAVGMGLAGRLLPRPVPEGTKLHTGWQSRASASLNPLFTRLNDRAIAPNNEARQH